MGPQLPQYRKDIPIKAGIPGLNVLENHDQILAYTTERPCGPFGAGRPFKADGREALVVGSGTGTVPPLRRVKRSRSEIYGNPCQECGFSWDIGIEKAEDVVCTAPTRFSAVLKHATGRERHPELSWSVTSYVLHVGDNLKIWAERIAGITPGSSGVVASYDENELAAARVYAAINLPAALWSLERSTRDWLEAVHGAPRDLVMVHPVLGTIGLPDIMLANAHDVAHHVWDVERSLCPRPADNHDTSHTTSDISSCPVSAR